MLHPVVNHLTITISWMFQILSVQIVVRFNKRINRNIQLISPPMASFWRVGLGKKLYFVVYEMKFDFSSYSPVPNNLVRIRHINHNLTLLSFNIWTTATTSQPTTVITTAVDSTQGKQKRTFFLEHSMVNVVTVN